MKIKYDPSKPFMEQEVILTSEEADAIIKTYEHHLKYDIPQICDLLDVDMTQLDTYEEWKHSQKTPTEDLL